MADLIIKDMEMPKACGFCCFCTIVSDGDECAINSAIVTEYQKRPKDCPLRPAPEWISVEERLPEAAGNYIVAYHPCYWDDVKYQVTNVGIDAFRGKTTWAKNKHQRVTHWMPLPEVPE